MQHVYYERIAPIGLFRYVYIRSQLPAGILTFFVACLCQKKKTFARHPSTLAHLPLIFFPSQFCKALFWIPGSNCTPFQIARGRSNYTSFQIMSCFNFSGCMAFAMHLDNIASGYRIKVMYLEKKQNVL